MRLRNSPLEVLSKLSSGPEHRPTCETTKTGRHCTRLRDNTLETSSKPSLRPENSQAYELTTAGRRCMRLRKVLSVDAVKYLLFEAAAQTNMQDNEGRTLLFNAVQRE